MGYFALDVRYCDIYLGKKKKRIKTQAFVFNDMKLAFFWLNPQQRQIGKTQFLRRSSQHSFNPTSFPEGTQKNALVALFTLFSILLREVYLGILTSIRKWSKDCTASDRAYFDSALSSCPLLYSIQIIVSFWSSANMQQRG